MKCHYCLGLAHGTTSTRSGKRPICTTCFVEMAIDWIGTTPRRWLRRQKNRYRNWRSRC